MPVYNPRKSRIIKTAKVNECNGCGRILPAGSMVMVWSVWIDGLRERFRFCSDCQGVIYGCSSREGKRRPIDIRSDEYICRDICECCDEYPVCGKVDYLRECSVGDVYFGDLPIDE